MTHTLLPQNNVWNSNCLHIKAANIFHIAPTINFSHFFRYTHLPAMEDHMTCWILQLTIQQEISPSLRFWANSHSKFKNLWKFPYIHMDLCACTSTLTHTHIQTAQRFALLGIVHCVYHNLDSNWCLWWVNTCTICSEIVVVHSIELPMYMEICIDWLCHTNTSSFRSTNYIIMQSTGETMLGI